MFNITYRACNEIIRMVCRMLHLTFLKLYVKLVAIFQPSLHSHNYEINHVELFFKCEINK